MSVNTSQPNIGEDRSPVHIQVTTENHDYLEQASRDLCKEIHQLVSSGSQNAIVVESKNAIGKNVSEQHLQPENILFTQQLLAAKFGLIDPQPPVQGGERCSESSDNDQRASPP